MDSLDVYIVTVTQVHAHYQSTTYNINRKRKNTFLSLLLLLFYIILNYKLYIKFIIMYFYIEKYNYVLLTNKNGIYQFKLSSSYTWIKRYLDQITLGQSVLPIISFEQKQQSPYYLYASTISG